MMAEANLRTCAGGAGHQCQIGARNEDLHEYEGRHYCMAHLPMASQKAPAACLGFIKAAVERGCRDFSGSQVPGGELTQLFDYRFTYSSLAFRDCTFGGYVSLHLASADLRGSTFQGPTRLIANDLDCSGCSIKGTFACTYEGGGGRLIFRQAVFNDRVSFVVTQHLDGLAFDRARFARALELSTSNKLPRQTTFVRTTFLRSACQPDDEGKYRDIRNLFHTNRAREWEGLFYALEKRCHRRSLPPLSFARGLSWLYDVTAEYGQSYERAFAWFLLVQLGFAIGYSVAADRWQFGAGIDDTVVLFTMSQVAKPFELLSARAAESPVYRELVDDPSEVLGWAVATFFHGVASILLIALFLLALRWRFRRE